MYRITYDGLTIFDPYGNANEVVSDASMSVEVNASAYLDFTMAMTHPLYDTIRERAGVVTLTWDSTVLFEGIIESIEMDIQGNKSISCVSAMDYLNDTHVRPYSTVAGEADLTAPSSVDGYFQWLINQHNDHVLDASKMFDIGINQGANLQQNNFIYRSSESEPTTASEITDQILDSLGGYLTMRYEDGRKVLDLYADLHTMNAQIVDFGVNITDFTKTTDTTDQYTAILLHGGSPTFEGGDLEGGDWSHWETHPNTPLVGDQTHGGSVASYFVSGTGEYINDSFFYSRPGRRYKATVYVKNERGSNVTIRGSYQYEQAGGWTTVNVNSSLAVENKGDQWTEFSFDFQPNLSEYTKIRPRWYFDNVGNDGNRRVYLDDFSFSQIEGDTEVSEDPIGLKQVPDGVSSFDADVFKSGDVLYSTSAVERYGYKEEVFEDTTITNIDDLVQAGIKELNKSKDPQITLDIKAVDLALFMEGYTHLNVGDAVRVRSAIHDTDEFLMVNSITLDLQDPGQSEYVIGKAYDSLTGQQSGFLRSLNSGINSSLDAVASLDQTTKDQAIQIGSVEQVANQAQQTANNAQNTANNAQQTANSNKQSIADLKDQQSEQDKLIEQMQQGIADSEKEIDAINDRIEQMDIDADQIQANINAVRQEAQTNFETAKNAADAAGQRADAAQKAVDSLRESTSSELQNVKDSVSGVRSDVDAVEQKAADLASELDGTKATVEQVTTDLGEVKTTVSNAATKADQALQVSTSASQTATEAQTTATSAYRDAQSALTQSSVASQTANAVKTELETKYSTTDEIAEQYATKSLVEQTSQSITSTVEATYATKATVEALENIANNAVQTWMGSGVPTLSNKPASDWTTAELKSQHSGDIYYDTDTGYSYRFGSSDGKNYSWSLIKDTDISKAVADAAKAQQTAEGVSDEVTQLKTDIPATYATKTEVKQTTDSIKSSVSEVATTANSALSKATTVEQTAKGLQTTVTEQAEKLDSAVTTISQVSQRVDSVSSTITQVSGRVDDVEDKADAAQGTANSAMSQASRVEQSLDSFKTSVSRDYQTKTEALSQKSELEQNINSFKTTVSETYTTKDEFNALEIGGTNLIKGSKPYGKSGFFEHFNSVTDNEYGELTLQSTTTSQSYPNVSLDIADTYTFDKTDIVKGDKYVISYDVMMLERTYTASSIFTENWIGIRHNGGNWSGIIQYNGIKEDFLHAPLNKWAHFEHSITANAWDGTTSVGSNIQLGTKSVGKFRFRMRNVKLEKGTKATAWSPAPEDFDGKYTSKTEFKQTTDKISATATAASQNASSALSKVGSLEVSVDGIDAKVEENAQAIDQNVKTTSQVSQRVDSLSSTITQVSDGIDALGSSVSIKNPSFETGDLTDWTTDGFAPAKVSTGTAKGKYRFEGLVTVSSGGYAYLRSSNVTLIPGHTYRLTVGMAWLDQNANVILCGRRISDNNRNDLTGYSGTFYAGYWHAISGKITVPSDYKVEDSYRIELIVSRDAENRLVCDDFTITDITDADTANDTANSALSKSSSVEQNLNSFKTSVSQTYETKNDALNKQSSLQQSVNNLRTEVSETYTTKTEFDNLQVGGTNLLAGTNNGTTGWSGSTHGGKVSITAIHSPSKLVDYPRIEFTDSGSSWRVATYNDTSRARTIVANSAGKKFTLSFDAAVTSSNGTNKMIHASFKEGDSTDNLITFGSFSVPNVEVWNHYELTGTSVGGSITKQSIYFDLSTAMAVDGTAFKICNLKLEEGNKATPWSPAPEDLLSTADAAQTYSTKSYVDQTARTVSLGVVEEYKNGQHGSALATASDITVAKDSITSTVSKTYLTKTDATNTYLNKNTAASTYTTKEEMKDYNKSVIFKTSSGHGKPGYFQIARIKPNSGYINYPIRISITNRKSNTTDIEITYSSTSVSDPSIGSFTYKGDAVPYLYKEGTSSWVLYIAKAEAHDELYVIDYSNPRNIPLTWLSEFTDTLPSGYKSAKKLIGSEPETTYSTKSYVDQTARTVSLGVVEEYKNGQHGSALATASDITVAKDSITSTVSKTYLTKTDATNTYLNKNTAASTYATKTEVKQTSDSLTVTISSAVSKAESAATAASNAQNTANTAKNNAANAQSTANTAKTNAATAQSTANTANSNAQNAQNRVGNLETCIKMTSDGVRVGKISNGNFTGYSALVNSAGSFDILDSSSKTLAFFNKDGLNIKSSSDRGMFVGFDSVSNSGYIGSTPKVATSEGGQSIDIGMSMGFASGGYLSILNSLGGAAIIAKGIDLIATGGKRVRIDMMDVRGAGVVLFDRDDNNNYASIDIAPRYKFSDFNYIMCFFKTNDGNYFGGTAYHPDGKEYNFSTMGGQSTDMSYLKGTRWGFNGTRAERKTTFEIGPGYSTTVNDSVLHIVAIIGFDYYKTSG